MIAVASYVHPIPPPTEPLQYRAIGVLRGRYYPSETQLTKGVLVTHDGVQVDAVVLGRLTSLLKKHLDLSQEHLWVVYPRTRKKSQARPEETPFLPLHVQIMGVWEPEALHPDEDLGPDRVWVEEDYFSIRGEVVRQNQETQRVAVRIRRAPTTLTKPTEMFKLELKGTLPQPGKGMFWDLQVKRQGTDLVICQAHKVAAIVPTKKAKRSKARASRPAFAKKKSPSPGDPS